MITNLQIRNFRGLKDVTLRELRQVNLLVGGNDTGKTIVLEAMILLLGNANLIKELPFTFRNNQSGGINHQHDLDDKENFWPWLFYDRNSQNSIEITGLTDGGQTLTLSSRIERWGPVDNPQITIILRNLLEKESVKESDVLIRFNPKDVEVAQDQASPDNFRVSRLSVRPSPPVEDAEKYNQIALEADGEKRFEEIMREVEPRLKRLRYAKLPNTSSPLVFVDLGLSRAVPATQMGQAFNRLLHIYAEILTSRTNVLLIDEVENGIFSESLPLIWKGLFAICQQQNVQIFATTHSRECIMAAHQAAEDRKQDELSVQRLQFVDGNIEAIRLGEKHLEMAAEMGLEVRS
jgi:predicted ATP-dependent endonuclease of OLD family